MLSFNIDEILQIQGGSFYFIYVSQLLIMMELTIFDFPEILHSC